MINIDHKRMGYYEQLITASFLCSHLAEKLDAKEKVDMATIFVALQQLHPEIVHMTLKEFIGMDRILYNNLDSNSEFLSLIDQVTQHLQKIGKIK